MKPTSHFPHDKYIPHDYCGRILRSGCSDNLKGTLLFFLEANYKFDLCGCPSMPYIAAWRQDGRDIWYEYVSQGLLNLLKCDIVHASEVFRSSLRERRIYRRRPARKEIYEEIVTAHEIQRGRRRLRGQGITQGQLEALYKLTPPLGSTVWLKDLATIKRFPKDGINLSVGCLSDVTKEMEQKELLEKIGYFDELTKLPKRKILEQILEVNFGHFQRGHIKDFSFLMLDIDHFKRINDKYGHLAGDHVLASLAELMNDITRKEERIGRYGGEEFYAVSMGDIHSGKKFAERLRQKIARTPFNYHGVTILVTVSIGVASASELEVYEQEPLVRKADRRLYAAKKMGRNRVIWTDDA